LIKNRWYYPENLAKIEKNERENENNIDLDTDYGSYKVMLKTGDKNLSKISNHNDVNPQKKISILQSITKKLFPNSKVNKLFNLGCGLGYETKALSEVYNCNVSGIDLSVEGIEFAKKYNSNSKTTYINKVVDKNFLLSDKFNICYAIEFYPFSRSNDLDFQIEIIEAIFNNLKKNGLIIIYQLDWIKEKSVTENIKKITDYLNIDSKVISNFHPKVYNLIPSLQVTNIIISILSKVFKKTFGKTIIYLIKK
tara:strand:- start:392 stop:1147 length:756 start_codon:yes stop_codon:yes gene_type:complete